MEDYLEELFYVLSYAPGPFWLILLFLPMNQMAMRAFDLFLIALCFHFAIMTIPQLPELLPMIADPEFDEIKEFMTSRTGFVGAWNHMILGDLWIARWVCHDSIKSSLGMVFRVPFIISIMFFGPLGLALYLLYRMIFLRKIYLLEN